MGNDIRVIPFVILLSNTFLSGMAVLPLAVEGSIFCQSSPAVEKSFLASCYSDRGAVKQCRSPGICFSHMPSAFYSCLTLSVST